MMAMKKAATCFWCGYCTLRAVKPVRHCGRTAIICDSLYLQEKSGALQQLPAARFWRWWLLDAVGCFDGADEAIYQRWVLYAYRPKNLKIN